MLTPTTAVRPGSLRLYRTAAAAVAGLIVVFALISWAFSNLILQPQWSRPEPGRYARDLAALMAQTHAEAFRVVTDDGLELRGLHIPQKKGNTKAVVMLHGYGGNLLEYQTQFRLWSDLGYDVFLYDQRGSGASDGRYLTAGVLESRDLAKVIDWVSSHMPRGSTVGVYGRSGGGASSVLYAAQGGRADFMVIDCAFSNFPRILRLRLDNDYRFIPALLRGPLLAATLKLIQLRTGVDLTRASPVDVADQVKTPVLFVTTAVDHYVPATMTREIYDRVHAPKSLGVFPAGDHGQAYLLQPQAYTALLKGFLDSIPGLAQ